MEFQKLLPDFRKQMAEGGVVYHFRSRAVVVFFADYLCAFLLQFWRHWNENPHGRRFIGNQPFRCPDCRAGFDWGSRLHLKDTNLCLDCGYGHAFTFRSSDAKLLKKKWLPKVECSVINSRFQAQTNYTPMPFLMNSTANAARSTPITRESISSPLLPIILFIDDEPSRIR